MWCISCGAQTPSHVRFCPACGAQQPAAAPPVAAPPVAAGQPPQPVAPVPDFPQGGPGRTLTLTLAYPPLAFLYAMTKPKVRIGGVVEHRLPWGSHRIPIPAGPVPISVVTPYLGIQAGRAHGQVDPFSPEPVLQYKAPWIVVMRGDLAERARYRGGLVIAALLALMVVPIVVLAVAGSALLGIVDDPSSSGSARVESEEPLDLGYEAGGLNSEDFIQDWAGSVSGQMYGQISMQVGTYATDRNPDTPLTGSINFRDMGCVGYWDETYRDQAGVTARVAIDYDEYQSGCPEEMTITLQLSGGQLLVTGDAWSAELESTD